MKIHKEGKNPVASSFFAVWFFLTAQLKTYVSFLKFYRKIAQRKHNPVFPHLGLPDATSCVTKPSCRQESCPPFTSLFWSPHPRRPSLPPVPPSCTPALYRRAEVTVFVQRESKTAPRGGSSAWTLSLLSLFLSPLLSMVDFCCTPATCPKTLGNYWGCPFTSMSCQEMYTAFLFSSESDPPY